MVTVRAFQGVRYNLESVADLSRVVAPPFDVISPQEQDELHERHPLNYVRVILPRDEPGNGEGGNRYTRSAATLKKWLEEGVLLRDREPAFYVYEQTFAVREMNGKTFTRRSFIGAVLQEPLDSGQVYPHETTHTAPKEDRLRIFTATGATPSQTFALFPDPEGDVRRTLERAAGRPPTAEFTDSAGILNRFWVVTDPEFVDGLSRLMADRPLVIADGHHRYETTLLYREVRGGRGDGSSPVDYMPMCLAAMEDPGIVVLSIHRAVHGVAGLSLSRFLEHAAESFAVAEASREEVLAVALARKQGRDDLPLFGLAARDESGAERHWLLRLKDLETMARRAGELPAASRALDLTVLHLLLLEDLLGIGPERLERKENLTYFKEAEETLASLRPEKGGHQLVFICRATPVPEIFDVVRARQRMPQKSTYFYPKVLSGLVLRLVE